MLTGEWPNIVVHCSVTATARSGAMAKPVPSLPTVACGKQTIVPLLLALHRRHQLSNSGACSVD